MNNSQKNMTIKSTKSTSVINTDLIISQANQSNEMIDAKENKAFTKKINDNSLKKFSKDIQKYTALILNF